MTQPTPQELLERGLAASIADDCTILLKHTTSANLRWANNTLTTNGEMRAVEASVISFKGDAVASVSGAAGSLDQLLALVEAADVAASAAAPAEDRADLVRDRVSPDWAEAPEGTSIGVYDVLAPALGEAFGTAAAADRILYGFVDHEIVTTYLASTTGLRLRHVQPTGHWTVTGKSADLDRSAWVGGATRDFTDVDPIAFEATLAQRLAWAERSLDLPAGRYDTILPPTAVADLAIYAYWTAAARPAHEGRSVFGRAGGGTRIGESIARPSVSLFSDPLYHGLECAPFHEATSSDDFASVFDNGLPLDRADWIRGGVLAALGQTRFTAAMTGQPLTPYVDNLILEVDGATGGVEELVAGTDRGLLLTCLWYIREVDPQTLLLTGLTRDGVYLVEGGEIVGAVNNFRFNESPVDLLARFSRAGATVPTLSREWGDYFGRTAMPPLRVPDFNMSSVSQAR